MNLKNQNTVQNLNGFGVSVSLSKTHQKSQSDEYKTSMRGTNLQGKEITLNATDGDLILRAAKLEAQQIALSAKEDIYLLAAANQTDITSSHKSSSVGAGVTFAAGSQSGISFQLSASQSKGKTNGHETIFDNTRISATDYLEITSGKDTNLIGAQVAAEKVKMQVGGDLTLTTLQDASSYHSEQKDTGFSLSLCLPPICYGGMVMGSVSYSKQKIDHNYLSAIGQTGIFAGGKKGEAGEVGGFDITVGGHTQLNGAAITSGADKEKNRLTTGSLGFTDLQNHQETSSSSTSFSAGYGGGSTLATIGSNLTGNLLGNLNGNAALPKDKSEESQTKSVISSAEVMITGNSGNSGNAGNSGNSGNSGNTSNSANTSNTDNTSMTASESAAAELTNRDPETANQSLKNTLTLQQAAELEKAIQETKIKQQITQNVGAVMSGLIGDISAAQSEANPELWKEGGALKTALHGISGLIQGKIAGGDFAAAMSGALGAASYELLAKEVSDYLKGSGITGQDHDTLMQLSMSLVGTAVGAVSSGKEGAAAGGNAAYTGVQNNFLKHGRVDHYAKLLASCKESTGECREIKKQLLEEHIQNEQELITCWNSGASACRTQILSEIDTNGSAYNRLFVAEDAFGAWMKEDAAKKIDLLTNGGKGGWVSENMLQSAAHGITSMAYGLLGFGSVIKQPLGSTVTKEMIEAEIAAGNKGVITTVDTLALFDKTNPSKTLNIGGARYTEMPFPYSNKQGTAKVFDTSQVSNQSLQNQVFEYAENLAGVKLQPAMQNGIQIEGRWFAKLENGTTITVRNVSSSNLGSTSQNPAGDGIKPRWTVDFQGSNLTKVKKAEVKFK